MVWHTGGQSGELERERGSRDGPLYSRVILLSENILVLTEALLSPGRCNRKVALSCGLREHSGSMIVAI